ncbi:hypothetical protein B0H11DRAFT_1845529 [Mycena galericulata]|nr:hypothetical protein B0H11DRAFT_1845529 [Mycena galericulata]
MSRYVTPSISLVFVLGSRRLSSYGVRLTTYTLRSRTLLPLLKFPNLTVVRVEPPLYISLNDAFVESMAAAWPQICDISFQSKYDNGRRSPTPGVSLAGISAFARHCPHLHTIRMPINATNLPGPPHPVISPPQRSLTFLHVIDSPIDSSFDTASFLSAVFPTLDVIWTARQLGIDGEEDPPHHPADAEADAKCKEVGKLTSMFSKIREEEDQMRSKNDQGGEPAGVA